MIHRSRKNPLSSSKGFLPAQTRKCAVYFVSGEEKGPTLLIIGGIHGDESGGYLTAERYAESK